MPFGQKLADQAIAVFVSFSTYFMNNAFIWPLNSTPSITVLGTAEEVRSIEVSYECQGLPQILQPIARIFLVFFINVVIPYVNEQKFVQSV